MNTGGGRKNKKKAEDGKKVASKEEEEALRKDAEDLKTWIDMIENMNDEELKGYIENHPEEIKEATKVQKTKNKNKNKVQSTGKKSKSSTSTGILASVLRFHKD